jgi:hypothetical protein
VIAEITYNTVAHTCRRCGLHRNLDAASQRRYESRNPEEAAMCLDCRGLEKHRQRDHNVPLEAILEAVQALKAAR